MKSPLISILTPCFNSEAYLKHTIDSVLGQSYGNWEMLLIDDGSTDSTIEIIDKAIKMDRRIKLIRNSKNSGAAFSRNRGIEEASGELIAFLDSDDLWNSDKLQKQINAYLQRGSNFIFSNYSFIDEGGYFVREFLCPKLITRNNLLKGSFIGCLTVLVSKSLIGNTRFKKTFHEDYLFWLELLDKPNAVQEVIRESLAQYRIRPASLSSNKFFCAREQWKIYRFQLQFPILKSVYYFSSYILRGILKHYA